ncbi:hypothetical protein O7623_29760 [Solwaraspora sp. WMMD791]|uniref:hypothetical protein n=1 Tax=Solwaraspora sp. WMMD791 TaxID=3016086 RepID=UPI00249BC61B|nr:hypothetical protein [Solwaraspora sp. WMMD791]WFE27362.1 hypothetical protein O7623_29760 [Solwaraspora sp. WMMD791]
MKLRQSRPVRQLTQVFVVALALLCVALANRGALDAGITGFDYVRTPGQLAAQRRLHQDFEAIRKEFIATVPAGSRVIIDPPLQHLWLQRFSEFTALAGGTVVVDRREADYQASLVQWESSVGRRYAVELTVVS